MMTNPNENNSLISSQDIMTFFKKISRNILVILLLPIFFGFIGFYYTYNMTEYYGAQTQILIKNDETYNYQQNLYQSLGYYEAYQNMSNQVRVIQSRELISRTLKKLDYNIRFFIQGRLKTEEETEYIPFKVTHFKISDSKWYNQQIDIVINDEKSIDFIIGEDSEQQNYTIQFNDTVRLKGAQFYIEPTRSFLQNYNKMKEISYFFKILSDDQLVSMFKSRVEVTNEENTSILNIAVQDELPKRAIQFLDTLMASYIEYSLENKFKINENTLKFIDRQLDEVSLILSGIEDTMDIYKTKNSILDLPKESSEYFSKMIEMDNQKREWRLMLQDLNALEDYILSLNTLEEKVLPSSYYVSDKDVFLAQSLKKLYELQLEKNSKLSSSTKQNLNYKRLVDQINLMKTDLLEYITNSKDAIIGRIRGFNEEVKQYAGLVKQVPKKERGLLKINRRLQVNEKMYLYLLEKKSNTIIARAGIVSESKIIEKSRSTGLKSPNKPRYIFIFVLIGFTIAGLVVFLREFLFRKIKTLSELESVTSKSILGQVYHVKNYSGIGHIYENPKGRLAEAFRSIRAKITFMKSPDPNKAYKVLVSSVGPGEGKTYTSINTALTLATAGHKVALVELDMHKPRIYKAFKESPVGGLSSFLVGKTSIDNVVVDSNYDNLSVAFCGTLPPSPSDIIQSDKMSEFFAYLDKHFDYVVIDTPPLGLISDALVLQKYADLNAFVLNTKISRSQEVKYLEKIIDENNLKNVGLILNGVKVSKWRYYYAKYGYGYSYGYGYGYGYGYVEDQ